MVDDIEEDPRRQGLTERPVGVLSAVARKVLHDEEGKPKELEAQGSEHVGGLERLIGEKGHRERGKSELRNTKEGLMVA